MNPIKIDITILEPVKKVWDYFIDPKHITKWNFAHESWQCPKAESDFKEGGKFSYRMEAKDKSFGFDFSGKFEEIAPFDKIQYRLDDNRKVDVLFEKIDENTTKVIQIFEPETENTLEMQREGWYSILNNFHKYVENH